MTHASHDKEIAASPAVRAITGFASRIDADELSSEQKFEHDRVLLRIPAQADYIPSNSFAKTFERLKNKSRCRTSRNFDAVRSNSKHSFRSHLMSSPQPQ